jgi:hypothetical protein
MVPTNFQNMSYSEHLNFVDRYCDLILLGHQAMAHSFTTDSTAPTPQAFPISAGQLPQLPGKQPIDCLTRLSQNVEAADDLQQLP